MDFVAWCKSLGGRRFQKAWDRYAAKAARGSDWAGDEWGRPELWQSWFERLFRKTQVESWARAVEIGQGTGKYTRLVLEAGKCEVLACDVSSVFLDYCRRRQASFVEQRRLHLALIKENDPRSIQDACAARGWSGEVDALYSMDALVHLPFTQIACYMLAGTEVLRLGGHLLFSFADGTSAAGHAKLLADIDQAVVRSCDPATACFHWNSPQLIRTFAERIGYEVLVCDLDPIDGRDGHFVARLVDRQLGVAARAARTSAVR